MFITKEAFNPLGGTEENQLYSGGVNERFAHEIAHQYWGARVKMPSHEEQWLTESFAEYSAALFIKAGKGEAEYKSLVNHWRPGARLADGQGADSAGQPRLRGQRPAHAVPHPNGTAVREGAAAPRTPSTGSSETRRS